MSGPETPETPGAESRLRAVVVTPGGGLAIVVDVLDPVPDRIRAVRIEGEGEEILVRGVDIPKRREEGAAEAVPDPSKRGLLLNLTVDMAPSLSERTGATVLLIAGD